MIDLLVLGLIAVFAFLGWRRGTVLTLLSGAGLIAGYVAAFLLYRPVGDLIAGASSLSPMIAYPLGGMLAMLGVSLVVSVLVRIVHNRRARRREEGFYPSPLDRAGGAALGTIWALGVVAVLGWGATVLQGITGRDLGVEQSVAGRMSAAVMGNVVQAMAGRFTGDQALAETLAVFAVRPMEAIESVNRLASDERLRSLMHDSVVRRAAANRDVQTLAGHPGVSRLLRDPDFLRDARNLELIDGLGTNATQLEIAAQLTERIGPLVQAGENLARDAEVQRLVRDSRLAERIEGDNVGDILSDADFNTLIRRFLDELRSLGSR